MKKSSKIWIACISALVVAGAVAGFFFGRWYIDNKRPNYTEEYVLFVPTGMTVDAVVDSLVENAGAVSRRSLERTLKKLDAVSSMKPGRYEIKTFHTSIYTARMLILGWQTPGNLTLSGTIRTKGRLAKKIGTQMMVDSAAVASALEDAEFLAGYGFTPENVFAMILPDTYQMYWTASVKEIFDRFRKEYDRFWTEERVAKAKAQGLTPYEVSVMASIVSGETLKSFEYPKIAGVYLNRYHKGMKLQADPTVCFCYDYKLDRVLKKHLSIDSPYNTYRYKGLPPAPINVPPKACLEAVLNPDSHGYIYFCASAAFDGTHKFAVTYQEHMKNAREFQRELTARRKAKQQNK